MNSRRSFLAAFASAGAALTLVPATLAQAPRAAQVKPGATDPDQAPDGPALPSLEKRTLEGNEKEIKKKVERLYDLVTELKAEVDKTDSSKVLSLNLVKKADEIEKLAHEIKTRSRG
jgi:hypothetical protein